MNELVFPQSPQGAADQGFIRAILRQRSATDDLLEKLRNAGNALSPGILTETVLPGLQPATSAARARAGRIVDAIWAEYEKAAILREQQMSELPDLTQEQIDNLSHLDRQMLLLAPGLSDLFAGLFPFGSTIGKSPGDWIAIDEHLWISFDIQQDFDSELAQVWQKSFGRIFGGVRCRMGRPSPGDARPHFEFRPFADDLKRVNRPEHADIKSDLLLAVLPSIPELAFAAKFVELVYVRIGSRHFIFPIGLAKSEAADQSQETACLPGDS
ncbi:hypothetical protein [Rhodoferax sp.]|uniref:hypothetical protein n=1 Tax=Rhodoferax sp. TaxID=50421 RepID=UPI00274A7AF2|nr:hypothetical protein [Rhodoferax sp.]